MAEKKSSGAKKAGSGILLGLLAISLVGFGAVSFTGNVQSIGEVGDEKISTTDYFLGIQNALRNYQAQTRQSLTFLQADQIGIPAQVRSQLLSDAALDNAVTQMGLSVGDEEVREQVLLQPAFQGLDGSFDRETYRFSLEQIGLNESEFESRIRKETARGLLQSAVAAGVAPSVSAVDTMFTFFAERRSYNLITLSPEGLAETLPEPEEAALQAFYNENEALFTVPEARDITYAWITPAMVLDSIEVDETVLQDIYQQRLDNYVQPERRLVERLVYPDQAAADGKDDGFDEEL